MVMETEKVDGFPVDDETTGDEPVDLEDLLDDGDVTVDMSASMNRVTAQHTAVQHTSPVSQATPPNDTASLPTYQAAAIPTPALASVVNSSSSSKEMDELRQQLANANASLEKEKSEREQLQSVLAQYEQTVTQLLGKCSQLGCFWNSLILLDRFSSSLALFDVLCLSR
jgi:hypothetical protein